MEQEEEEEEANEEEEEAGGTRVGDHGALFKVQSDSPTKGGSAIKIIPGLGRARLVGITARIWGTSTEARRHDLGGYLQAPVA